jgi:hypothetical protein
MLLGLPATVSVAQQAQKHRHDTGTKRANELTLGGLRPGVDNVSKAQRLYGKAKSGNKGDTQFSWDAFCRSETLQVTTDTSGKIQEIRTETQNKLYLDCGPPKPENPWWTGKHLALNDLASRVVHIYGEPDSRSPSTKDGQRLELLYYAFDWAGADVPQVMEVLCTVEKDGVPGRVVEITLAASSL